MATKLARRPILQKNAATDKPTRDLPWKSVIVDATAEECAALWRDVHNLQHFLSFIDEVQDLGNGRSRWLPAGRNGRPLEWLAERTEDGPYSLTWRPLTGESFGLEVRFRPATGRRGTVVRLRLKAAKATASRELHRFKAWKETGETPTTEGQPHGKRGPMGRLLKKGEQ